MSAQPYDPRLMATNPHLVPVFQDQPAPPWDDEDDDGGDR